MADSLTASMCDHIAALLVDQIALFEFQDWLLGETWDVEQHADPEAADLPYSAKLALAELIRGDIGQGVFRARMRDLVRAPVPSR